MSWYRFVVTCALAVLLASGCQRRTGLSADPDRPATAAAPGASPSSGTGATGRRAQASRRPAAGMTCSGRDSCTSDQVCVEGRCRYRETSVAGEVLASAAAAQAEAGNASTALETYELAFAAFERARAPVPPEVACGAAELALRTATDGAARELGARRADLCFRTTLPGDPGRLAVQRALTRVRFDGLEVALFDREEPAEQFFTQPATRPSAATMTIDVQMPDLEPRELPSHTALRSRVTSDEGRAAIAACFLAEWEERQTQRVTASVAFSFTTRLLELAARDDYEPVITVQPTTAQSGFEPCVAAALPGLFDPSNRALRGGPAWNQTVRITASAP